MLEVELSDFKIHYIDDVLCVRVNLSRATYREALDLKDILDTELALNKNNVVIDLTMCEFMDSTFIGVLVVTHKKLIPRNGIMVLVEPDKISLSVLSLVGAFKLFRFFKTTQAAVNFIKSQNRA